MQPILFFVLLSLANCVVIRADDLDAIIISLIPPAYVTETPDIKKTIDGEPCECAPYYLCNRNTTTDGLDLSVDQSCDSVSVCCRESEKLTQSLTPAPILNTPKKCGTLNPEGVASRKFKARNDEVQFGEVPWMVEVLQNTAEENSLPYLCEAALIHPQAVLTVAHCVDKDDRKYKIRAGEWDTQTTNEPYPYQTHNVAAVIKHPEYNKANLRNEIAILILETPVEIRPNVDVLCLPHQDVVIDESRCFSSSWGKSNFGKEGIHQVILKKLNVVLVPRNTCQDRIRETRIGPNFELHDSFICATSDIGRSICNADRGSPLVCPIPGRPGRYFHAGLLSWRFNCEVPSVYVNVPMFADWIHNQLVQKNFSISYYDEY